MSNIINNRPLITLTCTMEKLAHSNQTGNAILFFVTYGVLYTGQVQDYDPFIYRIELECNKCCNDTKQEQNYNTYQSIKNHSYILDSPFSMMIFYSFVENNLHFEVGSQSLHGNPHIVITCALIKLSKLHVG